MQEKAKIESLGIYLPSRKVSTDEVIAGCHKKPRWDLEKLTGIKERRVVENEYAIDLAIRASQNALAMSRYQAKDLDMIICTSISKYNALHEFEFEPANSARIREAIGATRANHFDVVNACAGMFTGVFLMSNFIKAGIVKCGLVVSGEFITPLAENAKKEIRHSFDGQLASLTLGDCGAALILDPCNDPRYGFHYLDFVTGAKYQDLCIAKPSSRGTGAVMYTRPVTLHKKGLTNLPPYFKRALDKTGWTIDQLDWIIPHQTSVRAIRRGSKNLEEFCRYRFPEGTTITNVEKYGNTSSTTHSLVLHEYIRTDRINQDDNLIFLIGASGIVIGNVTYTMDDLPQRYRASLQEREKYAANAN